MGTIREWFRAKIRGIASRVLLFCFFRSAHLQVPLDPRTVWECNERLSNGTDLSQLSYTHTEKKAGDHLANCCSNFCERLFMCFGSRCRLFLRVFLFRVQIVPVSWSNFRSIELSHGRWSVENMFEALFSLVQVWVWKFAPRSVRIDLTRIDCKRSIQRLDE